MSSIPAFSFMAFPEDSDPMATRGATIQCFNTGLTDDEIDALTDEWLPPLHWPATSTVLVCLGLFPFLATLATLLVGGPLVRAFFHDSEALFRLLACAVIPGLVLAAVGIWWGAHQMSENSKSGRIWKKELGEAWLTYGGQVIVLKRLPKAIRAEVSEKLSAADKIRKGLNRLNPQGDELDDVRYAMQRFIEASDIPLLSKRAADAPHILDPKVRQAAREYKTAVKFQESARRELELRIGVAEDLLAARRQDKTDAEIIKLVNER